MEYKKVVIEDFPDYQIDTNGIIYGKNGSPLKPSRNKHGQGYCIVQLRKDGKTIGRQVHVLVAKTFLPNTECKLQVNHIDGNKENNCVDNLEWTTPSENMRHAFDVLNRQASNMRSVQGFDKKSGEQLYEFDSLTDAGRYFAKFDNTNYKYCKNSIWRVLSGNRKSYKNCIWKYTDNPDHLG